jgi:hypothetical protein
LHNQVIYDAVRFVDMFQGAMTQSMGKSVVFSFCNVTMRLVEQLERSVIAACAAKVGIDRRMIIQILPVVNGGVLDFTDRFVDLGNGVFFLSVHPSGVSFVFQMSAGVAQVGKRVQVCRMILSEAHRGAKSSK